MEPKPEEPPDQPVDDWGLPVATTHMDEPIELELGYCAGEDPEDIWDRS